MWQSLVPLLAGLGIFFAGVKMVGTNLKQMTSRRLRILVSRWAQNPWLAAALGAVTILITQSASAVTFLIVSLISGGLIAVRQALPMLIWANGGACVLVLIAMLDIHIWILFLLGVAGISFYFDKPYRFRNLIAALFGLGLLFFGLQEIKTSAASIADVNWLRSAIDAAKGSYLLALGAGAALSFVVQSSPAVSVVAIAMTQAGVFPVEETMMIIYGTNLGSSLTVWVLSSGLKGTQKQLAMAQVLFNVIGCVLFVAFFYLETGFHIPLIRELVSHWSRDIHKQMAYVYFAFNLFTAIALSFLIDPLHSFLTRRWPPTAEEDTSKLKYIHDQAIHDPETAMDLVRKEQVRLLQLITGYLQALRSPTESGRPSDSSPAHIAFQSLAAEVQAFLDELLGQNLEPQTSERLVRLFNLQSLIGSLEETVYQCSPSLMKARESPALAMLSGSFVEVLDTILQTLIDTFQSSDVSDRELLLSMTGDRGAMMEKIRNSYLTSEVHLNAQERSVLLFATNLFERIVWITGRIASLLRTES